MRTLPKLHLMTLAFLLLAMPQMKAQKGTYLQFWGGPQLVGLPNFNDYSDFRTSLRLNRLNTWRAGMGVNVIYNFADNYGLQTGLSYSQQGQKYSGVTPVDGNNNLDTNVAYTSHVYLDYLRLPIYFRFTSVSDPEDIVTLSVYAGMYVGYFLGISSLGTDPAPPIDSVNKYSYINLNKVYNKIDIGLGAGAEFNIRIKGNVGALLGVKFERSASTIENRNTEMPYGAPVEWSFPLSIKKQNRLTEADNQVRMPTKNDMISIYAGISYKFNTPKKTPEPERTE